MTVTLASPVDLEFIERHTTVIELRDGTRVLLRPVVPEDKARLAEGFKRLSPESRYRRFHGGVSRLTPALLRYLTEVDYDDHFAWGAFDADHPERLGMGVARYVRLPKEHDAADAAVTVLDEYQGRGLGTVLLETIALTALEHGIRRFRTYVLAENGPMIGILTEAGARLEPDSPGVLRVDLNLPEQVELLKSTTMYEVLRAVARGEAPPRTRAWPLRRLFPGRSGTLVALRPRKEPVDHEHEALMHEHPHAHAVHYLRHGDTWAHRSASHTHEHNHAPVRHEHPSHTDPAQEHEREGHIHDHTHPASS